MGRILSINRIPSCKFVFPNNLATISSDKPFTIQLKIQSVPVSLSLIPLS
jgi:hypothetical protein